MTKKEMDNKVTSMRRIINAAYKDGWMTKVEQANVLRQLKTLEIDNTLRITFKFEYSLTKER